MSPLPSEESIKAGALDHIIENHSSAHAYYYPE